MENLDVKLDVLHSLPEALLTKFLCVDSRDLYEILPNPTLIDLSSGNDKKPLFIATLLHGNETTGFYALQRLLKKYLLSDKPLPRDLIIFIGNVQAASHYQRRLEGQVDYNRIWAGGPLPEHDLAQQVLNYIRQRTPFACIDIHNNTGSNPYYGCVNQLSLSSLHLAKLFSSRIVYFTRPYQTLSVALNQFTNAITIESGLSGEDVGIDRVFHFIDQVMMLDKLENERLTQADIQMFHSIARIFLPKQASVIFDRQPQPGYDFTFLDSIETLNFHELPENSCIGWRHNKQFNLMVFNEKGEDVSDEMFKYEHDEVRTRRSIIPSMLCTSEKIIRQDCFGYIMQRYVID